MKKIYLIVTNDEYELPVTELVGARAVAEWLGMSVNAVRHRIMRNQFSGAYRAYPIGRKHYDAKRYRMEHDRTEYFRQRYRMRKEVLIDAGD